MEWAVQWQHIEVQSRRLSVNRVRRLHLDYNLWLPTLLEPNNLYTCGLIATDIYQLQQSG